MDSERFSHPSMGKMRVSRVSGNQPLVGVDFPTGHYMTLEVSEATQERRHGSEYFYSGKTILSLRFSEIQWAQFLSSPNTDGVPCTIEHRHTDGFVRVENPITPPPMDISKAKKDVEACAADAMKAVKDARAKLTEMLKAPNVRKGDLNELVSMLATAEREALANLPYAVQCGQEALVDQQGKAKGEVDAFINYSMTKLGERAYAAAAQAAIDRGEDPTKYLLEHKDAESNE